MKKISLLTILFIMFLLSSCNVANQSSTEPSASSSIPTKSSSISDEERAINAYNSVINHNYNSFEVVETTTKGDLELTSTYNVTKNEISYEISYSIESYNEFDITSDSVPDEMISTRTGTYTAANNQFSLSKFVFDKNQFASYEFRNNSLTARISNAKSYLGVDYDCNNFEMVLSYTTSLTSIRVSYYLSDQTYCQTVYKNFA